MKIPGPKHCGFSLVELMVSMAVGTLILFAAAAVLGSSGDGYERVVGGMAAEREARAAVGQLAADLSTAIHHKDAVFDRSAAGWPADHIGFLSLQPADAQSDDGRIGDLCAASYYIKDITIAGKTTRCLMRGFRESSETFKALENADVNSLFAPREHLDEPIAFGVVSFQAGPCPTPGSIEVRLVIARRALAARLKTSADWDGAAALAAADEHEDIEIHGAILRFGTYENP
jgi:prepilin-type N-terminal cleavage/methylation domain-containing protein